MKKYDYFYTNYIVKWIVEKLLFIFCASVLIPLIIFLAEQIHYPFIKVVVLLIIMAVVFMTSWFVTMKITNRKGTAICKEYSIVFQQGNKQREIRYEDIKKIHKERIRLEGTQIKHWGPIYVQYVITTKRKKFALRASVLESWQAVTWKDVVLKPAKKPTLSIDKIIAEIEKRMGSKLMIDITKVETTKDIALVVATAKEVWEEHYTPIIGEEQVMYMLEKFQSNCAIETQMQEGYLYYILKKDKEIVGYMGVVLEEEKLFLSKLYLTKKARGQGVSKQAMQYLEKLCRIQNIPTIYLTCNKHNENTLQVYTHLGFNKIREQVSDIGNGYVMDDYVLEKQV